MGFILPDLVLESIIRDGLQEIKNSIGTDNDKIEDIFSELKRPHLSKYFGQKEINEIKKLVNGTIYLSAAPFQLNDIKTPNITIVLTSDTELEALDAFGDFKEELDTNIDPRVVVDTFDIDVYDDVTGLIICINDDPDLSGVRLNFKFIDGDGNSYNINSGISNDSGNKHFFIDPGLTINPVGCQIVSNLAISRTIQRAVRTNESLLIAIATEQPSATKYLYTIIKYIILSNKVPLIERGIELSTFNGSDFSRMNWMPDHVFTRFLTLSAKFIEHSWNDEEAPMLESVDPSIKVQRDQFRREDEDELTVETVEE